MYRLLVLSLAVAMLQGSTHAMSGKKLHKAGAPQSAAIATSLANILRSPVLARARQSSPVALSPFQIPNRLLSLQSQTAGPVIVRDPTTGVPRLLIPSPVQSSASGAQSSIDPSETARTFLAANAQTLQIANPAAEFSVIRSESDNLRMTHVLLKQTYAGLEVWGSDLYVHLNADGQVTMLNGSYHPTPQLESVTPSMSREGAVARVRSDIASAGLQEGVPKGFTGVLNYDGPDARLMIWFDSGQKAHLVWFVEARAGLAYDWNYFVDAQSGKILDRFNTVCSDGPTTASAQDLNGVSRTVDTYLQSGTYYMLDAIEPMYNAGSTSIPQNVVGGIMGLDLQGHDLNAQSTLFFSLSATNSWTDPAVISAHFNAKLTYNYFRTVFGRNSIDDKGMTIYSVVHVTSNGQPMDNAFWSSTLMAYGDGNTAFTSLAGGFDVAAHEMTHGVTQHTANLVYKDQSGALNESMSDVFAASVDSANWTIGEQVIKDFTSFPAGALRDLSDPHNGGTQGSPSWQPASMSEFVTTTGDNGGVHVNSGIPNNAYYRTATAIGRGKASHIWYRALTNYLTSSAQFVDARIATEAAAKDLFGDPSAELTAVQTAWTNVGVGSGNPTPPPPVPQLEGTNYVVVVNSDPGDPNSLYLVRPVLQGNSGDFVPLSTTGVSNRPAVSDTGGVVVFVDDAHRLKGLSAGATPNEVYLDTNAVWASVAIGPGLGSLALTSIFADTSIYYIDLVHNTTTAFKIRTQAFDGAPTGTALYSDAMSFDPTGHNLLFDSFNEMQNPNGSFTFWTISLLDLTSGHIQGVFPPQSAGIDIGNPSFSKSSATRFVFDMVDNNAQTDQVMGADFFSGTFGMIVGSLSGIGFPTYSGDGTIIAYHDVQSVNNALHDVIQQIGVDAAGTGAAGSPQPYLIDAVYPVWFVKGTRVTSVDTPGSTAVPTAFKLEQNYPNPFNPSTTIEYTVGGVRGEGLGISVVRLSVYDVLGREVAVLVNEQQAPGTYSVRFDGTYLSSGIYFYRLVTGDITQTRKMILAK